jgi:hypothetical protein
LKKIFAVTMLLLAAIALAGCSEQGDAPDRNRADNQRPKTVVVNEGMSEEEEEKLNERLAELEDEVNDQSTEQQPGEQPTQEIEIAEDPARAAAQAYYAAAGSGNYSYTYNELSSYSRSQFTEDEWVAANTALGSDEASYTIDSVNLVDGSTAEIYLTIDLPDGSTSERLTRFLLENGGWKHDLTQEEYDLFAGAAADAPSASPSPTPSANADTKHIEIVITTNKPADVSIYDDSFTWAVNEEIVGTETYERDIPENSGLSVTAITAAYRAETSIEVYEDGSLVARDTDSYGNAIVTY